ncbi:MAG: NAD-dependent epimerase/dehydratase family protein [Acidobacteriota bacterium]
MKTIVVTGGAGFIGRNLLAHLEADTELRLLSITRQDSPEAVRHKLGEADLVYHLAGSNRPERVEEFYEVNEGFTQEVVHQLVEQRRTPPIVLASSTQVERDNEYGRSKKAAEEVLERYAHEYGGAAVIYRLTNVFGKWSRPNYNSVVATFCYNVTRGLLLEIHDPGARLRLVHVDDLVECFRSHLRGQTLRGVHWAKAEPVFEVTLQQLADQLRSFHASRQTLRLPDLADRFTRLLHSTYLSYLPEDDFAYPLQERKDDRGKLAELLKSDHLGQIFVSTTRPGVIRGNHYHHSKIEKFCVVRGEAVIRFRKLGANRILTYPVSGERLEVVDIPPGYTHSIENIGCEEIVVLFWANEIFDPDRSDTQHLSVEP